MVEQWEGPDLSTSRRGFMKLGGATGLGLALTQLGPLSALAQSQESVKSIIDIAATAEALAVTLTGAVIAGASKYDNGKGLPAILVTWVKGIQAEEQAHYEYLTKAGAQALTLTFTVPQNLADITTSSSALLKFVVAAETIFIGAYTAAGQEFTQLKQPDLAMVALQIATVESQHRVLANYGLGASPPNDVAFEKAPYRNVAEAAATLKQLGLLGGVANPAATLHYATFASAVDFTGVSNRTPPAPAS